MRRAHCIFSLRLSPFSAVQIGLYKTFQQSSMQQVIVAVLLNGIHNYITCSCYECTSFDKIPFCAGSTRILYQIMQAFLIVRQNSCLHRGVGNRSSRIRKRFQAKRNGKGRKLERLRVLMSMSISPTPYGKELNLQEVTSPMIAPAVRDENSTVVWLRLYVLHFAL